jgi:hypothetical protein
MLNTVQYLEISYGVKHKLTIDKLLDISIALISFNENATINQTKLDINLMLNHISTFNYTQHQQHSVLLKLTFMLLKSNNSRAVEYFQ